MPRATVPFPASSSPGVAPPDARGRLVNARVERDGDVVIYPRVAGLVPFADIGTGLVRGMVRAGALLWVVVGSRAATVTGSSLVAPLVGSLDGSGPVTIAFNAVSPVPHVVVATSIGAYVLTETTVDAYPDPNLPGSPTSVSCFANYFMFTFSDGQIFASDLNSTAVNALSFTRDTDAQGLLRGIPRGRAWYAMGPSSIGVYSDEGSVPFPLSRQTTIPVGLFGKWAVAGDEEGWDSPVFFVASDRTVRRLDGYSTSIVSSTAVERALQGVVNAEDVRACVYVERGSPIWCVSNGQWTWCYDVRTGSWFERKSAGRSDWQGKATALFSGRWIVGNDVGPLLHAVSPTAFDEAGSPLIARVESSPLKEFPSPVLVDALDIDMTTGTAPVTGAADTTSPTIMVEWSGDGGATWRGPVHRSLGRFGEHTERARVNGLGRTTDRGLSVAVSWSSAVYTALRGGSVAVRILAPK